MSRIIIILLISLVVLGCEVERPKPEFDSTKINMGLESGIALNKAYDLYDQAKSNGQDFSNGPCLSNELFGNPLYPQTMWVLDITHNPKEEVDDQPENQCSSFREGQAQNFIELDPEGQLIKIYSPYIK